MNNNNPAIRQTQNQTRFDQKWLTQVGVFLIIILMGIAGRFWLVDLPNFKPVAALILFGAFYFRRSWVAVAALVVIMMLSDIRLGVYDWKLAGCVYASLALAGGLGIWIKQSIEHGSTRRLGPKQAGRFLIASLAMSTAFYVFTNGAVWFMGQWYPSTWSGLTSCYAAGLPFYRATLMGDLFFTGALAGSYCAVEAIQVRYASRLPVAEQQLPVGVATVDAI